MDLPHEVVTELKDEANGSLQRFQTLLSNHKQTAAWFTAAVATFGVLYPALKGQASRYVAAEIARKSSSGPNSTRLLLPVSIEPVALNEISDEMIELANSVVIDNMTFKVIENEGNGDCQFMAFTNACGLEHTPEVIYFLRAIVAEALPFYPSDELKAHLIAHQDIKSYKKLLKSDTSINLELWQKKILKSMWGDALTLQILLDYFDIHAQCYNLDNKTWNQLRSKNSNSEDEDVDKFTLYLLYFSEIHYDALLLVPK